LPIASARLFRRSYRPAINLESSESSALCFFREEQSAPIQLCKFCLLIDPDTCPNLAAEGSPYAYDPDGELPTETPIDRDNHALSALRYLVMGLAKRSPKPLSDAKPLLTARLRLSANMLRDEQLWASL